MVRVGWGAGVLLLPPQPAKEKAKVAAITKARDTGTLRNDDLMGTKDTKGRDYW
jgi:hypothetical protein